MNSEFVNHHNNPEQYALVHSKTISKIRGAKKMAEFDNNDDAYEGLVKIKKHCKRVYRKCCAQNGINGNEVELGYRTLQRLGCTKEDPNVEIVPTNWFCYLWHHYESSTRVTFRIAAIALLFTIAGLALSIINLY